MRQFKLLGVGEPPSKIIRQLGERLSAELEAEVRVEKDALIPNFAYISSRGQYNSTDILAKLDEMFSEFRGRVIGITNYDLCIPILTFVFGEAQLNGRAAVVALKRLYPQAYGLPQNEELFQERLFKETLHEIGHTYGMKHCPDWNCVMHTSNMVDEIDIKGGKFCSSCNDYLL